LTDNTEIVVIFTTFKLKNDILLLHTKGGRMELGNESYIKRDYQILGTVSTVDEFGGKIKIKKDRTVSVSYRLNKRGVKMVNSTKDFKVLDILTGVNSKVGIKVYQFIRANASREGLLVKVGTSEPATIAYIAKKLEADRSVISKCINSLIKEDLLKKDKRKIYLDPMCYLPLVNDYELRCLMERYEDDFTKPLDYYRAELQKLNDLAVASVKAELPNMVIGSK